eukprot:g7674.t1
MKKAPTSPFSSPKCQLPDTVALGEAAEAARTRPRRKPAAAVDVLVDRVAPARYTSEELNEPTGGAIRRTRTVPTKMGERLANEAERAPIPERRQRRNLSRVSKDDLPDDALLVDTSKRVSCSSRNLKLHAAASERSLANFANKRATGGRAATPLDIPFYPNTSLVRTVSAEPELSAFLDDAVEANRVEIRRTRTQIPPTHSSKIGSESTVSTSGALLAHSERVLRRERSLNSHKTESSKTGQTPTSSGDSTTTLSIDGTNVELQSKAKDSAKDFKQNQSVERHLERRISLRRLDTALPEVSDLNKKTNSKATNEGGVKNHVITVDRPTKDKNEGTKSEETQTPERLAWWQVLLHYIGLIFVQYPFKEHKQWLDKMYKANRLPRPENYKAPRDWTMHSNVSNRGTNVAAGLPSLPENSSSFRAPPPKGARNARVRRRTQLDVDDDRDEFNMTLGVNHSKRTSSIGNGGGGGPHITNATYDRPPPGHLPRSHNISIEREGGAKRKKNRLSVEIFGDIMHLFGLYPNAKGRLKLPHGIAEMDESELSGFQARFYHFIKRHHKGRLARAWDHILHPLDSMQRKHRRSTNKVRLLNAIDKHRAQKFDDNFDMVKTKFFLCGQWLFEAFSPPKYTKKPMLLTVLFPLVLILFFGFMAGEYSYWRDSQGHNNNSLDYKFGPEELSRWFVRSGSHRTFDDEFLIVWGARYLPRVTSESWRWLISMLIHENFAHLGGNILLFVLLSWSLESKYGFWRTGLVCWLSGLSGNFMSAVFEDSCGIILGASGCVFGLAAFYIIDVVGDFRSVSFPGLKLLGISIFLCAFIIALTSQQSASHLSHIGGLLCGFVLGLALVPRFIDERIEAWLPWIAFITTLALLCVLPLVVFCSILPTLECSS